MPRWRQRACAQLRLALWPEAVRQLSERGRFALVKVSHPGHEHRNLPRALAELQVLAGAD